jgi:hypothetical protein
MISVDYRKKAIEVSSTRAYARITNDETSRREK